MQSQREPESFAHAMTSGRMSRRQFIEKALGAGLSVSAIGAVLAACGDEAGNGETSPSPAPMDTTIPEEIVLFNYADYMSKAVLKGFEEETGIKVVETFYDTPDMLMAKMRGGATGYDVIVPSPDTVAVMKGMGVLQPLNTEYIPNLDNVDEAQKAQGEIDGQYWAVPYQWGFFGVAVNTEVIPQKVTSWTILWDETYKKQISMLDNTRGTIGSTLKMLGYSCNSTSEAEVDEATDKLIQQKPLVLKYDMANNKRSIVEGLPLVMGYPGDCVLAVHAGVPVERVDFVAAEEGFPSFLDMMAIPKAAASPYGAHLFLNYILEPNNMATISNEMGFLPPIAAAAEQLDPVVRSFMPTAEEAEGAEFMVELGEFLDYYNQAWVKVKAA